MGGLMKRPLSHPGCRGLFLAAAGLLLASSMAGVAAEATTGPAAVGGTVIDYAHDGISYRAHVFTQNGTLTVSSAGPAEILVVGGGGGGGAYSGGGGGAGGVVFTSLTLSAQAYPVVAGSGGRGGADPLSQGGDGANSAFGSVAALGGGRGGVGGSPGFPGASGGGGGYGGASSGGCAVAIMPAQGHDGGSGITGSGDGGSGVGYHAGGGGGAGGAGGNATHGNCGDGGTGIVTPFPELSCGHSVNGAFFFAGGGGGGDDQYRCLEDGNNGLGGNGGGGNGGDNTHGTPGMPNTGGGGGGGSDRLQGSGRGGRGGNGGSGIVIVRYVSTVASTPDSTPKPATQPPSVAEPRYKVVGYKYNSTSARGVLSVDIQGQGIEARKWVIKNIGEIASSKELLLEAGKEATSGGRYKILDESFADGILTLQFEVLH